MSRTPPDLCHVFTIVAEVEARYLTRTVFAGLAQAGPDATTVDVFEVPA